MALKIELGLTPNALTMQESDNDKPKLLLVNQSFQLNLSALKALKINLKDDSKKQLAFILINSGKWDDDKEFYLVDGTNLMLPESGKFSMTRKGSFSNMAVYEQLYFPGNEVIELEINELKVKNATIPALKMIIKR